MSLTLLFREDRYPPGTPVSHLCETSWCQKTSRCRTDWLGACAYELCAPYIAWRIAALAIRDERAGQAAGTGLLRCRIAWAQASRVPPRGLRPGSGCAHLVASSRRP